MSGFISRGFRRATGGVPEELADRVPPGQYVEPGFPGAHRRARRRKIDPEAGEWSFRIDGMVATEREWSWEEFNALESEPIPCDIHCVTKWSKLGTEFTGVSMDLLFEEAEPLDAYAMVYSYGGYTTNLSIEDLSDGKAWVVTEHEGEPLPREHGGPARLLVPHLYFWKSAKWVAGPAGDRPRRARLLGGQRLPQPRRPLEGRALLERLAPVSPLRSRRRGAGRSRR